MEYQNAHGQIYRVTDPLNWQPIDTAPKDGTHILVCQWPLHGDPKDGLQMFVQNAAFWPENGEDGEWVVYNDQTYELPVFFSPTHWLPLPAPPAD